MQTAALCWSKRKFGQTVENASPEAETQLSEKIFEEPQKPVYVSLTHKTSVDILAPRRKRKYVEWYKCFVTRGMSIARKKPSIVYWLGEYLYLNIANRCSNNCYFCFRRYKRGVSGFNLKLLEEPTPGQITDELQNLANKREWKEVVFCGFGEPLERLDCVLEVTKWIKKRFPIVVRIDTNGQASLVNKGRNVIEELKQAGVDRISVSLNAHDEETYNYVCKPKFEDAYDSVIGFIETAKEQLDTEITTVTIPEVALSKVKEIAEKMKVKFRLREYHPCFW